MQKYPENIAASKALIEDLRQVGQDVAGDHITRLLYSTDASIYQMMPVGVAWPRNKNEVAVIVEIAKKHQVPVLPRGSGSSLAGQAIGHALILDFSRYMDQVIEINLDQKMIKVESGVVLGPLNRILKSHNLMFGPDPASADRATLGGVIGNNATGAHSILYGMTHDHLLAAEVVLSDGSEVDFKTRSPNEIRAIQKRNSREGMIYNALPQILDQYQNQISNNYPKTFRNVAGYNLNILGRDSSLNPAVLLAGSEGTLGIITSATLNLVPRSAATYLYLVHFPELQAALEAVPTILDSNPSAVELIDRMLIQLARSNPAYKHLLAPILGNPAGVLAVEYQGDDPRQLSGKESYLSTFGKTVPLPDEKHQEQIWKARKVGLGILQSTPGDAKPTAFIEDAAVPVNHLASYAMEIKKFAEEIGVGGIAFYAHASAGCLHIRPQVNLKSPQGIKQMRMLAEKSLELVLQYGGTTSGEHGEGIARGEFMERLYGPELVQAFQKVKEVFDPEYLLNPGKIIDPPVMDHSEYLRYGSKYQANLKPQKTFLSFEKNLGFDRAVEMCNGAGVCRQLEDGVMCPTFQATRDEKHSTRGRANMLRAAMSGVLGAEGMTSRELFDVLDLCLSCQACTNECPSAVDMSKLKAEFLYQYYQVHRVPLRNRLFANIEEVSKFSQPLAFLVNPILKSPVRRLLSIVGIHPERQMPPFANQTFSKWYQKQNPVYSSTNRQVVFFYDTYLEYNYPKIGKAVTKIFKKAGIELIVPLDRVDSGRPSFSKGLLTKSLTLAKKNLKLLIPYANQNIPILGCEPSDVVMLTKEYQDLLPGKDSQLVAKSSTLVEKYLIQEIEGGRISFHFDGHPRQVLFHGHCQHKANYGTEDILKLLRLIPNCSVTEINAGCCGMAGAFGYEKEHYHLSLEIAEMDLAPHIRESSLQTIISASGTSCREQIQHTTAREAVHPLEIFASALI